MNDPEKTVGEKKQTSVEIEKLEKLLDQEHAPTHPHEKTIEKQLTDFLANVSHEIKTPLALLKESISLLADEVTGKLQPQQKEYLGIAQQAIQRLTTLVENLLDAARLTSGKITLHRKVVHIPELLDQCVREFRPLAQKRKLRLEAVAPKDLESVFVDEQKVEQILHNLVGNALRFAKKKVRLHARKHTESSSIEIDIVDDGTGMPQKELRTIFRKYYQFGQTQPSSHKGLGLGLAIAKELTELHGGTIWAESIVGMGSRFAFTLPIFPLECIQLDQWLKQKAPRSGKEFEKIQKTGWMRALLLCLESGAVDKEFKEEVLQQYHDRGILNGESPHSLAHIEDFMDSPLKNEHGHPLCALNVTEAFLMAHIEKNMGDYSLHNIPIYQSGETAEQKRIALMTLVKSMNQKEIRQKTEALVRVSKDPPRKQP